MRRIAIVLPRVWNYLQFASHIGMSYYSKTILSQHQPTCYYTPQCFSHPEEQVNASNQFDKSCESVQSFDVYQEYSNYASENLITVPTPHKYTFGGFKNILPQTANSQFGESSPVYTPYEPKPTEFRFANGNIESELIIPDIIYSNDDDEFYDDDDSQSSGLLSTPENEERRRRRRERNKVAATKCRHKKKEHVLQLNVESQTLENSNMNLKTELHQLQQERSHLINLLANHRQFCNKHM